MDLHYVYKQQKCVEVRPLYIIGRNSSDIYCFAKSKFEAYKTISVIIANHSTVGPVVSKLCKY